MREAGQGRRPGIDEGVFNQRKVKIQMHELCRFGTNTPEGNILPGPRYPELIEGQP